MQSKEIAKGGPKGLHVRKKRCKWNGLPLKEKKKMQSKGIAISDLKGLPCHKRMSNRKGLPNWEKREWVTERDTKLEIKPPLKIYWSDNKIEMAS